MSITLTKTIERNDANTIDINTSYLQLNTKAGQLVDDVVDAFEEALNEAEMQINDQLNLVNTAYNYANAAKLSETNAKLSETNAQISATTATAKAALAQSVAIPTTATYNYTTQDWRDTMMSKAQFNALAAERRASRAGSGFDEMGKGHATTSFNVNEGIWLDSAIPNNMYIGRIGGYGSSRTDYPQAIINGVLHNISNIRSTSLQSSITIPKAPAIFPYGTTLTTEQIAMGCVTHADASNSGLIVNGKFTTDTSGWSASYGSISRQSSGSLRITTDATTLGSATQSTQFVIGKKYRVEFNVTALPYSINYYNYSAGNTTALGSLVLGYNTFEFTALSASGFDLRISSTIGNYVELDNIAVFPADAISRSDLVFLESWHEDVSEKDFVYPLGNVQYLGTTGDAGTPVAGAFSGSGTYSLFGNWQASGALVGKGYVWSTLSDANKKAFVANPENNCYLDGDKVIQVRYRMRAVAGMGDSWHTTTDRTDTTGILAYTQSYALVKSKGKKASISFDLGSSDPTSNYVGTSYSFDKTNSIGAYAPESLNTLLAYEGKCFALPIALVHRRNQGIAHSVFNSNGSKLASDSLPWYSTTVSFTSLADCFDSSKLLTASGYIGTTSGRPDGLFYDQVHESDILDLRMNSAKVEDYNRLIDSEFNKLVAGTYRGSEGENTIIAIRTFTKTSAFGQDNNRFYFGISSTIYPQLAFFPLEDNIYYLFGSNGNVYSAKQVLNQSSTGMLYVPFGATYVYIPIDGKNTASTMDTLFPNGTTITVIVAKRTTRTKSNTLTHTDIIGSPANYSTAWKQSGVSGTPLIVAEDGTSMLPTGALATFKLSRKANATPLQVLKSTDSGATWTALTVTTHYTFNTTTNVLTMVTAPATTDLIMVTYQTHTGMVVPAVNSEVLAIGDAWANNNNGFSAIAQSLIGKQLVQSANNDYTWSAPLSQKGIGLNVTPMFKTGLTYPSHPTVVFYGTTTPAVKTFPYLTRSNGKARLQLVFKEIKHNGTTWGDDSKFNIVDNVSTTTDNNAQTVLIGQKYCELPYFISAGE